jgi:hypothetical protein
MSPRVPFTLQDLLAECAHDVGAHRLDNEGPRQLGLRLHVPAALRQRYPYNASAYAFLQQLRAPIREHGLIELPGLPVNLTNHTLAQRAPWEHGYSHNPYLTGWCQHLHQDTPPYPTAFWLGAERRHFATWVVSCVGLRHLEDARRADPSASLEQLHGGLVPASQRDGWGTLVNHQAGLVLLDNSDACALYHARTSRPGVERAAASAEPDAPSYAFNEVGLLQHIDSLDERRGPAHRCPTDRAEVVAFLRGEARGETYL